ncbi:hypothetical protein B0H14DRAFT_3593042 [Mycena olivaceomarginata]|nr:hypothetical protein B0H14DRAFT_3593042 [Mycena olivaceomarginata]
MSAPPVHQYIQCPGRDEEHLCGEWIPSRLICRGSKVWYHAGLEYQVHNCGYFRWLAPELLAAAEWRAQDGPAGGAPPFPPSDYPHDPWAHSPPPSHSSTMATMAIDPALAASSTAPPSTQPRPLLSSSFMPPSTQLTQSGKLKCAVEPCKKLAGSQSCTYKMCKQCCERQQKGCRYAGHRKQQIIAPLPSSSTTDLGDPSALSRPTPMFSSEHPLSSLDAPPTSLPPKLHKKPMDPEWRKIAEEERRKQDLMFERQDGEQPEMYRQQGLKTLRLNMANYPELLKKMGLTDTDEIGIYDFDGRCWDREDVNHVREVVPREVLLVRRFGVKDCPRLDEYIAKYALKPVSTRRALPAAVPKRNRPVSTSPKVGSRPYKAACHSSPPSSPVSRVSSPSSMSPSSSSVQRSASPIPSLSSSLLLPASLPLPPSLSSSISASVPIDHDMLWTQGRVLNPEGCGTWPEGMYARYMVTGFQLVGSKNVADRFASVFGRTFPHGAWYQQQRAWKYSSQEERDHAAQLPRTSDGLWSTWRSTSSGWARVCKEKKR